MEEGGEDTQRSGSLPPPAAPWSLGSGCSAAPGPGAGWGAPSRAGRGDGLPSLTHWAGAPHAPAASLHPCQGRGEHGWAAAWEQGLPYHTHLQTPQLLWDALKLFPWGEEKQLTVSSWPGSSLSHCRRKRARTEEVQPRCCGRRPWGHPVESPSKTM